MRAAAEPEPGLTIELRRCEDDQLIRQLQVTDLTEVPHPGHWLTLETDSFLVLQRRHRYALRNGLYELRRVALQVRCQRRPADARLWRGSWVIGDPRCRFNARSPLLRCAVLPEGPCERCAHFALAEA